MHQSEPQPQPRPTTIRDALCSGDWYASYANELATLAGGIDALERLDADPLPDEPFAWPSVADRDRGFLAETLAAADDCCERRLDLEYRTIVRRLLARVATHDPRPLRRRPNATRCAAALVWLALRGNGAVGRRRSQWSAEEVWSWFRVSSCASLGRRLLAAGEIGGVAPDGSLTPARPRTEVRLTDVGLLHSRYRSLLLVRRAEVETVVEEAALLNPAARPITLLADGKVDLRGRPVEVLWTVKGMTSEGRAVVVLALGASDINAELLAFSVPQARQLQSSLGHALDASLMPRTR